MPRIQPQDPSFNYEMVKHNYTSLTDPKERETEFTELVNNILKCQDSIVKDLRVTEVTAALDGRITYLKEDESVGGIRGALRNFFTRISNIFEGFVLNSEWGNNIIKIIERTRVDTSRKFYEYFRKDQKITLDKINISSPEQITEHARNIQPAWLTRENNSVKEGLITFIITLFNQEPGEKDEYKTRQEAFLKGLFENPKTARSLYAQLRTVLAADESKEHRKGSGLTKFSNQIDASYKIQREKVSENYKLEQKAASDKHNRERGGGKEI